MISLQINSRSVGEFVLTFRQETLRLELASSMSALDPVGSELYLISIDELVKLGNILVKS